MPLVIKANAMSGVKATEAEVKYAELEKLTNAALEMVVFLWPRPPGGDSTTATLS